MKYKIVKSLEDSGWITLQVGPYWVQARVFDEPSSYGINGGRISKLHICKGKDYNYDFQLFSYDRGLAFDNMPSEDLKLVIQTVEKNSRDLKKSLPVSSGQKRFYLRGYEEAKIPVAPNEN